MPLLISARLTALGGSSQPSSAETPWVARIQIHLCHIPFYEQRLLRFPQAPGRALPCENMLQGPGASCRLQKMMPRCQNHILLYYFIASTRPCPACFGLALTFSLVSLLVAVALALGLDPSGLLSKSPIQFAFTEEHQWGSDCLSVSIQPLKTAASHMVVPQTMATAAALKLQIHGHHLLMWPAETMPHPREAHMANTKFL